ncbi:MAG: DUF1292 domain-containing protein [Clostridia bacterium]|nr:DUF1292 domain-containing protein [Clostridia bacterium]
MSEIDNIITLTDEKGMDIRFEFLDLVRFQGTEYVVLLPVADREKGQVVILGVQPGEDGEHEAYVSIEDVALLEAVFDAFRKQNEVFFDFP